jgi:hypothetical protein
MAGAAGVQQMHGENVLSGNAVRLFQWAGRSGGCTRPCGEVDEVGNGGQTAFSSRSGMKYEHYGTEMCRSRMCRELAVGLP